MVLKHMHFGQYPDFQDFHNESVGGLHYGKSSFPVAILD